MNCIVVDDDEASRKVLIQLLKQVDYINLVKECGDAVEAMNIIQQDNIDLMFLDIEMPKMSGMDMLKSLTVKPKVVLTTSHTEYALDAFEMNVVDYLVKPVSLKRFMQAMEKIKGLGGEKEISYSQEYFFIKKDSVLTKVPVKDILWIEALGDYITIHTAKDRYIIHSTLKAIEVKLPTDKFVRVHRSYIVQLDNVKVVEDTTIYINDVSIPIGALYKENFIKRLHTLQ